MFEKEVGCLSQLLLSLLAVHRPYFLDGLLAPLPPVQTAASLFTDFATRESSL